MGGSTKETTKSVENKEPWRVQAPYLEDAFRQAKDIYNVQRENIQAYQGDFFADMRPEQFKNVQQALDFTTGLGQDVRNTTAHAGGQMLNLGMDLDKAGHERMMSGDGITGSGLQMTQQGFGNAQDGLGIVNNGVGMQQQGFNKIGDAYSQMADWKVQGGVQSNIDAANQYADNPQFSGMVAAAMRDAQRTVGEDVLPNLYRGASAGGNLNSSRTAISDGLVRRGLAEKSADVSANMRGQAWQQGLQIAEDARQFDNNASFQKLQGLGAMGQAMAGVGQGVSQSGLGYAGVGIDQAGVGLQQAGVGLNMSGQGLDMRNLSQQVQMNGLGALDSSIRQTADLYSLGGVAGQQLQDQAQLKLDNDYNKYNYNFQYPWLNLQNYWGVVGDKPWGGTTTGFQSKKTETNPGAASVIGGVLGAAGNIAGMIPSDIRLKQNIKQISELPSGLGWYRYEYTYAPGEVQYGVMAQEAREVFPEAIHEDADGFLRVDYSKIH